MARRTSTATKSEQASTEAEQATEQATEQAVSTEQASTEAEQGEQAVSTEAEQAEQAEQTEQASTEQASPTERLEAFRAQWRAGIDTARDNAGQPSPDATTATVNAWRALTPAARNTAPPEAVAATMADAMADPTSPDTMALAGAMALRAAIDAAALAGDVSPDKVSARLEALRLLTEAVHDDAATRGLDVDALPAYEFGDGADTRSERLADAWKAGFGGRVPSLATRGTSGGGGSTGPRAASGTMADHVREALTALDEGNATTRDLGDAPSAHESGGFTVAAIRKIVTAAYPSDGPAPSAGALTNALRAGVDGVTVEADPLRARLA